MAEEKKKKEDTKKEVFQVVAELPKQDVRQFEGEDGVVYNFITMEEALTKIVNDLEEIKEFLGK